MSYINKQYINEFRDFANAYMNPRMLNYGYQYHENHIDVNRLFNWIEQHVNYCEYFNGFSIAKPPRNNEENSVGIRCSCGDSQLISYELWKFRDRNRDLEDVIQDINYKNFERTNFKTKDKVTQMIYLEVNKIMRKEELEIIHAKEDAKRITNPIAHLEII